MEMSPLDDYANSLFKAATFLLLRSNDLLISSIMANRLLGGMDDDSYEKSPKTKRRKSKSPHCFNCFGNESSESNGDQEETSETASYEPPIVSTKSSFTDCQSLPARDAMTCRVNQLEKQLSQLRGELHSMWRIHDPHGMDPGSEMQIAETIYDSKLQRSSQRIKPQSGEVGVTNPDQLTEDALCLQQAIKEMQSGLGQLKCKLNALTQSRATLQATEQRSYNNGASSTGNQNYGFGVKTVPIVERPYDLCNCDDSLPTRHIENDFVGMYRSPSTIIIPKTIHGDQVPDQNFFVPNYVNNNPMYPYNSYGLGPPNETMNRSTTNGYYSSKQPGSSLQPSNHATCSCCRNNNQGPDTRTACSQIKWNDGYNYDNAQRYQDPSNKNFTSQEQQFNWVRDASTGQFYQLNPGTGIPTHEQMWDNGYNSMAQMQRYQNQPSMQAQGTANTGDCCKFAPGPGPATYQKPQVREYYLSMQSMRDNQAQRNSQTVCPYPTTPNQYQKWNDEFMMSTKTDSASLPILKLPDLSENQAHNNENHTSKEERCQSEGDANTGECCKLAPGPDPDPALSAKPQLQENDTGSLSVNDEHTQNSSDSQQDDCACNARVKGSVRPNAGQNTPTRSYNMEEVKSTYNVDQLGSHSLAQATTSSDLFVPETMLPMSVLNSTNTNSPAYVSKATNTPQSQNGTSITYPTGFPRTPQQLIGSKVNNEYSPHAISMPKNLTNEPNGCCCTEPVNLQTQSPYRHMSYSCEWPFCLNYTTQTEQQNNGLQSGDCCYSPWPNVEYPPPPNSCNNVCNQNMQTNTYQRNQPWLNKPFMKQRCSYLGSNDPKRNCKKTLLVEQSSSEYCLWEPCPPRPKQASSCCPQNEVQNQPEMCFYNSSQVSESSQDSCCLDYSGKQNDQCKSEQFPCPNSCSSLTSMRTIILQIRKDFENDQKDMDSCKCQSDESCLQETCRSKCKITLAETTYLDEMLPKKGCLKQGSSPVCERSAPVCFEKSNQQQMRKKIPDVKSCACKLDSNDCQNRKQPTASCSSVPIRVARCTSQPVMPECPNSRSFVVDCNCVQTLEQQCCNLRNEINRIKDEWKVISLSNVQEKPSNDMIYMVESCASSLKTAEQCDRFENMEKKCEQISFDLTRMKIDSESSMAEDSYCSGFVSCTKPSNATGACCDDSNQDMAEQDSKLRFLEKEFANTFHEFEQIRHIYKAFSGDKSKCKCSKPHQQIEATAPSSSRQNKGSLCLPKCLPSCTQSNRTQSNRSQAVCAETPSQICRAITHGQSPQKMCRISRGRRDGLRNKETKAKPTERNIDDESFCCYVI